MAKAFLSLFGVLFKIYLYFKKFFENLDLGKHKQFHSRIMKMQLYGFQFLKVPLFRTCFDKQNFPIEKDFSFKHRNLANKNFRPILVWMYTWSFASNGMFHAIKWATRIVWKICSKRLWNAMCPGKWLSSISFYGLYQWGWQTTWYRWNMGRWTGKH